MFRKILCCVLMLCVLLSGCAACFAESGAEASSSVTPVGPMDAYTKYGGVNVRQKPTLNSQLVDKLDQAGTKVTVTGETVQGGTLWYAVKLPNGKSGYIRGDILVTDPSGVIDATPSPAPDRESSSPSSDDFRQRQAYTRIENVNVRQKADAGSKLAEKLEKAGTEVTVTGQAEDKSGTLWYAVRLRSGKSGYIRADLLTTDRSEVVVTPSPAPGSESSSSSSADFQQRQAYTRVANVNVRQKADAGSKLVEKLEKAGTEVTVTGQTEYTNGTLWYAVRLRSGKGGYIRADLLTTDRSEVVVTPSPTPEPYMPAYQEKQAYTRIAKVNVRQKADAGSKLVEKLEKAGTEVTVTGQAEDKSGTLWYAVRLRSGKSGFIRSDLLTMNRSEVVVTPSPTPTPKPYVPAYQEKQAYTRIAKVNVRQKADSGSRLVETLDRAGTSVVITGEETDNKNTLWYAVRFGSGRTGYIRSDLLTTDRSVVVTPTPTPEPYIPVYQETQAYTRVANVNVRQKADAHSKLAEKLEKAGTEVTVTGQAADKYGTLWYAVRIASGKTGYIQGDLLADDPSEVSVKQVPSAGESSSVQWQEIYLKDMKQGSQDSDDVCLRAFTGGEIDALPAGSVLGRYTFRSGTGMLSTRMTFTKPEIPARLEAALKARNETWILYIKEDDNVGMRFPTLCIIPVSSSGGFYIEYHWYETHVIDSLRLTTLDIPYWWEADWTGSIFSSYTIDCPDIHFEIYLDCGQSMEDQVTESYFPVPDFCLNILINELEHPTETWHEIRNTDEGSHG